MVHDVCFETVRSSGTSEAELSGKTFALITSFRFTLKCKNVYVKISRIVLIIYPHFKNQLQDMFNLYIKSKLFNCQSADIDVVQKMRFLLFYLPCVYFV